VTSVTKDTKVAMGKYNEQAQTWEAGDDIPNGLWGDLFKEPGARERARIRGASACTSPPPSLRLLRTFRSQDSSQRARLK
jgi:hypothetical protein